MASDFTTDQLTALSAAIANGVKEVRYGDKIVMYQTLKEMLELRSLMRRELGLEKKTQVTYPAFSKGFR